MLTNDALITLWDQWMRARNLADKTRSQYRYAVNKFLSERNRTGHVAQVTEQDIIVYLTTHGTRGPAKAQYMKGLKSFFNWCAEHTEDSGVTPATDPTRHIRPKVPPPPEPDAYSVGEVAALLHAAALVSQRRADALQTIYGLGLRRVEMCRLRPEDIEWQRDRVAVRGKGGKVRHVPMTDVAREALSRLEPANGVVLGITPECLTAWGSRAAKDAGIKRTWRSLHILRRSYATHLRRKGVDVAVIAKLLGHSNLAVTGRYFSIDEEDQRAAVALL